MISTIYVVLVCFFMVLINHSVNGFRHTPKLQVTSKPFKFECYEGDCLRMDLSFKLPPNVTGYVLFYSDRDKFLGEGSKFEINRPVDETGDSVVTVRGFITGEHVYIDVQLYDNNGIFLNKRIAQGVAVKSALKSNDLDSTYSLICLNAEKCQVEADLRKKTLGYKDSLICLNTEKCQVEADLRKKTLGYKGLLLSESLTASSLDPVPYTDGEIKTTKTGNGYVTIIICLSVFSIAMLVLAIASFTRSWWFKFWSVTPELLPGPQQKFVPFYVNLLFRKESQEIIDDLEQNHYELMDPFERR